MREPDYQITYDIPAPENVDIGVGGEGRPVKYPWADMNIGASFWKECPKNKRPSELSNGLTSAARNWARNNKPESRFVSRQELNGARVWRIS
jgi:hypothetical protein